ncbi:MAG TPA: CDP-alcohol phosphatidyltransferase family protein [Candidatus Eisenbacteria bacterium]|nr:CDP-alcohol phosphatidyltransferase family protein [Candidatus Eisenbacteria bacterium]
MAVSAARPARARRLRADHLTLARLVLLPLPVAMLYQPALEWRVAALASFILLGLTDVWDGRLARRDGPTRFGELLDILADRIFLVVLYGALADLGVVSVWIFVVILAREFAVGAIRSLPTVTARSGLAGKLRTSIQMYGAGLLVVAWIAGRFGAEGWSRAALGLLSAVIVAGTLATGAIYLWRARAQIAAGLRGRPGETLRVAAAAALAPLLWAPLVSAGPPLSLAVIALVAAVLARSFLESDLVPGRGRCAADADRERAQESRRLALLAAAGAATRLSAVDAGGAHVALALTIAALALLAWGIATRVHRITLSPARG